MRLLVLSAAGAAVAASLTSPATAADPVRPSAAPRMIADSPEQVAVGLIVETSRSTPSDAVVGGIARAAEAVPGDVTAIDRGLVTVPFDEPLAADEAIAAAAAMEQQPGVTHAEPNYRVQRAVASPVPVDDTHFRAQYGLWDTRFASPAGGWGIRAPYTWRSQRGNPDLRVAVIDTGYTNHADLDANRVAGYDFVSAESDPLNRDGVPGWDADATDPGDHVAANACQDENGTTFPRTKTDSSWHGTHVAGIVAAIDDNGKGVAGVAPNVKFQPIRVLGPCGGTTADIATAIRWAAGTPIKGVPTNPTPAKVINLSLGGLGTCDTVTKNAIGSARSRGAVVIAAAGNESRGDTIAPLSVPASCPGVISVVATSQYGQVASYSNMGTAKYGRADVSAPGGEPYYSGIYSTYNTGRTTQGAASYASLAGTSMATPHVSGAAALLFSLGYPATEVELALKRAVRPFPQYGAGRYLGPGYNCVSSLRAKSNQADCGRGILDLAQVPTVFGSRTTSGTARSGSVLSTALRPGGLNRTVHYRWYRDGKPITGATSSTYRLTSADRGRSVHARIAVSREGFRAQTAVSTTRTVAR